MTITFLSDYGPGDEYVGVVHGVIARIAPEVRVIDLGHGVPPQDVRTGARRLARALPYVPAGVHLAVVDPGVGGPRRAVALRAGDRWLVGPDNGLLLDAASRFGGVRAAYDVGASPWRLEPVSATFHGRDIFAPVAAHLALGEEPEGEIDPASLARLERLAASEGGRRGPGWRAWLGGGGARSGGGPTLWQPGPRPPGGHAGRTRQRPRRRQRA